MDNGSVALTQLYERMVRGEIRIEFDKIGFFNFGYWKGVEDSVEIAQINLIETLVAFFSRTEGTVLDVACGKGASTKFLTKYFEPENITGINISEVQLQVCRAVAPECNFQLMNATKLEFADSSFDNVLCIEAAQHFMTRDKFLLEAYRVLKPGGRLAIHDWVFHNPDRVDTPDPEIWPKENYLPDLKTYKSNLSKIGFSHVRVDDITEFSLFPAIRSVVRKFERDVTRTKNYKALECLMKDLDDNSPGNSRNSSWCMAYAIK